MRRDLLIAIILAVSAIPAGAALMVAPEYLHLTGASVPITFWGGIGLTAGLIVAAAVVALRGEVQSGHAPTSLIWKRTGHLQSWIGVLLLGLLLAGGYLASHLPTAFLPPSAPQLPSQLLSSYGKYIFDCAIPPPSNTAASDFQRQKEVAKQGIEAWGDAIGFTMTLSDIRGGIRIEAEATTDEAKNRMGILGAIGVKKFALEIRRVGQHEIVSILIDIPATSVFSFFRLMPVDPNSADMVSTRKQIERIMGVSDGTCHMI